jgi:chemosensory pili system protein ChpB (putative protein-glutamate methylesterase)
MRTGSKRIALFFDDADLGSLLRTALSEQGAQIAHEGPLSSFDEAELRQTGVDVMVVNLDDAVDDATLDRIYGLIESGDIPVVFNDAQASRSLEGWDRARWARHLTVKSLDTGTIDPPRPDNAREIDPPPVLLHADPVEPQEAPVFEEEPAEDIPVFATEATEALPLEHDAGTPDSETLAAELEALLASDKSTDAPEDEFGSGLKFSLQDESAPLHTDFNWQEDHTSHDAVVEPKTAEHESGSGLKFDTEDALPPLHDADFSWEEDHALRDVATEHTASEHESGSGLKFTTDDALPPLHDGDFRWQEDDTSHDAAEQKATAHEFGSGLKFSPEDELPPLHDGDFSLDEDQALYDAAIQREATVKPEPPESSASANANADAPSFQVNLDHLSLADLDEEFKPAVVERSTLAQQTPAPSAPELGFVEEDDHAATASHSEQPLAVEKVSASDYLAPDADVVDDSELPIEPGMSLELVSMEEAVALKHDYEPYETHLHELDTAFARLLVLGAARDSQASLSAFLAVLPRELKLPILLTQHQNNGAAEQLAQSLASQGALPVKVAATGMRARVGEVLVVPRGQQVRVLRDGRIELTAANEDTSEQAPSIDSSFTMAANVFGRDALAILFAGKATDAVAGAQAIHDRGGQVWVESSGSDRYNDMVNGVLAERLASFSGSPQELAVRLVEDFR